MGSDEGGFGGTAGLGVGVGCGLEALEFGRNWFMESGGELPLVGVGLFGDGGFLGLLIKFRIPFDDPFVVISS